MSTNKQMVEKYMEGFRQSDHDVILSCLADDVEWIIPGAFHGRGKAEFDKEIENENFTGRPVIGITRLTEENDVVIAEGTVRALPKAGGYIDLVFCDVFEMSNGRIRKLISYLVPVGSSAVQDQA